MVLVAVFYLIGDHLLLLLQPDLAEMSLLSFVVDDLDGFSELALDSLGLRIYERSHLIESDA